MRNIIQLNINFLHSNYINSYVKMSIIFCTHACIICSGFKLSSWRIPGVLQRFAVSYFVVALTELLTLPVYTRVHVSDLYCKTF